MGRAPSFPPSLAWSRSAAGPTLLSVKRMSSYLESSPGFLGKRRCQREPSVHEAMGATQLTGSIMMLSVLGTNGVHYIKS